MEKIHSKAFRSVDYYWLAFSAVLCYFYQSTMYSVSAKNTYHFYQLDKLVSSCNGIFRAEYFSVIQMGEQEKMWLSS